MAITSSAKKAIRVAARKRIFNIRHKRAVEAVLRDIRKAVADKNVKGALALVPNAYQAIDKAVKTNFIKKNTGSRMKSRLVASLNKVTK